MTGICSRSAEQPFSEPAQYFRTYATDRLLLKSNVVSASESVVETRELKLYARHEFYRTGPARKLENEAVFKFWRRERNCSPTFSTTQAAAPDLIIRRPEASQLAFVITGSCTAPSVGGLCFWVKLKSLKPRDLELSEAPLRRAPFFCRLNTHKQNPGEDVAGPLALLERARRVRIDVGQSRDWRVHNRIDKLSRRSPRSPCWRVIAVSIFCLRSR
jgi:hypothetical protein